jgi:hypothetical protein
MGLSDPAGAGGLGGSVFPQEARRRTTAASFFKMRSSANC